MGMAICHIQLMNNGDNDMAVHRIDDNAEKLLQELAKQEGKKPAAFLSDLVREYAKGLSFKE